MFQMCIITNNILKWKFCLNIDVNLILSFVEVNIIIT